jgi:hypothetical protein
MMEWTDKENHIAVITLHKCRVEGAHIFQLLKQLNIMCVFVCHTVKLFLDVGGVSDHKRSGWPCMIHMPQVINTVRSRINQNPVQKQKIMDIAPRTMSCIIK